MTGFDEARAVLADPRFSSDRVRYRDATQLQPHEVAEMAAAAERGEPVRPAPVESRTDGMFVFMDPPEHTRLRRLLTGEFTVRRMKALEARITEIAVEHIEAMEAAGTGPTSCRRTRCPCRRWSSASCSASTTPTATASRTTPPPR